MNLNTLGSSFFAGSLIHFAPDILKGAMEEYLGKIPLKDFTQYIIEDKKLWDELTADNQNILIDFGPKLGDLGWFNSEWLMESAVDSAPGIVSLLIGWPEGKEWLDRQIDDIKAHILGEVTNERPIGIPTENPVPNTD